MLRNIDKGDVGYIHEYKKRYGIISLALFLVIVAMVVGIYLILGTVKHIAVALPVLLALPLGKMFVLWLIVAKYRSISAADAEKIEQALSERRNCFMLYDMALSSYESVSYCPCIVLDQGNIYLLYGGATDQKYKESDQREYVQSMITKSGYPYQAVTVHSVDELIEIVLSAETAEEDRSKVCEHLMQRLLDVSV